MKVVVSEVQAGLSRVLLDGRLDAAGVQAGEAEFNSAIAATNNVIVDLEKVPFIASIGIRLLVAGAQAKTKAGGKMVMVHPDEHTSRILKTTGIDQLIPVFADMAAATAAYA